MFESRAKETKKAARKETKRTFSRKRENYGIILRNCGESYIIDKKKEIKK